MIVPIARKTIAAGLCWLCAAPFGWAQSGQVSEPAAGIGPLRPQAFIGWRPYLPADVPPVRLGNSSRIRDLYRAGKLYLTAQDAIALALENNLDIEVARYSPISLAWRVERAQAGGALPGVPSGATQAASVASGQGVLGSQAAAGVSISGASGARNNSGNATISQIGPVTQTLDPIFQESTAFSHRSLPQANLVQTTSVLVQNTRVSQGSYQQGLITGGSVTVTYNGHYLNENAPTDVLNPSEADTLTISAQHNLLNGFGVAVNARSITVAKINLKTSDLTFKTQTIQVVANVLNAYYALSADYEDLRAKDSVLAAARQFLSENRRRVELGALAPLDVITAESQLATGEQGLVNSQIALDQDELTLKNQISRNGVADPLLGAARIVPLDRIEIPAQDDLPPIKILAQSALAARADLLAEKANEQTVEVNNLGTKNALLPVAVVFATLTQSGLAGTARSVPTGGGPPETANPYFVGGLGTSLDQVFRRDFPIDVGGVFLSATLRNRQAQADRTIDLLSLRQTQLQTAKDYNQAQVDVQNSVVALRQARARYDAAVGNRVLAEQLLDAEQKKYAQGASTPYNVVQQQRDLASAKSTEIGALVSYSSARILLDQATGMILEAHHVSIADVRSGKVAQASTLPATLPQVP